MTTATTLLFGHDLQSRACSILIERIAHALTLAPWSRAGAELPQVEEIGSLEAAWEALDRAAAAPSSTLVVACLDLQPAPRAGVTFASWAAALALPVVVVTHSRRWLSDDSPVAGLPGLSPNASSEAIARALAQALAPKASFFAPDEAFPSRPSWLG